MDETHHSGNEALSATNEWAVYQCIRGCVHLQLQHLTLTFSACEFAQLVRLLGEAQMRLRARAAVASVGPH